MPTATAKTAWLTLTNSVTDANTVIRCLRDDPTRLVELGGVDSTALCIQMEHEWRTFLERAGRVEQRKGYIQRCANALALQIVEEQGPATMLALLVSEFKVSANLKDTLGTKIFSRAVKTKVMDNMMVLLVGCGKNKVTWSYKDPAWARSTILDAVAIPAHRHFDPISGTHVDSTAFLLKAILDTGASHYCICTQEDGTLLYTNPSTDYSGLNVWGLAAITGNTEVLTLLLAHSAKNKVHVDMNTTH